MQPIDVVIPMAGAGKRFADQGYETPKPLIDILGKPMIAHVLASFDPAQVSRFHLVMQAGHARDFQPAIAELERQYPVQITTVPGLTKGQACTVLAARDGLDPQLPMLIANCDEIIRIELGRFLADVEARNLDGLIATFHATDARWSFARTDESGLVVETAEKVAISTHATIGWYFFRRYQDYQEAALDLIIRDDHRGGEYYVCPVYNYLIARGGRVGIYEVSAEQKIGLGTPAELEQFLSSRN
jgi:NDP-sugar pyrophosphorylase family protein